MNVRDLYLGGKGIGRLVATERETAPPSQSLRRRLWLWRRGFLSYSGSLYDFETHGHEEYVTDYQRFVRTRRINGTWSVALSNKLIFHWLMGSFEEHRMDVHGLLREGTVHPVDGLRSVQSMTIETDGATASTDGGRSAVSDAGEWVADHLDEDERLVLKWTRGGGGNNVLLCSRTADDYRINGVPHSRAAFESTVETLDEYLICEFVEQGPFSAGLYPDTPNTLRIITMYDDDADEAFVPVAIQRIGTDESYPMDNFSQGGLSAAIDVETGELGPGIRSRGDGIERCPAHPDTDARIARAQVPGWSTIRDRVLEMAEAHPFIPYVGWDVLVTDDDGGFTVIEANSYPGLKSIQAHGPLLANDRVRRFYEHHGVC